MSRIYHTWDKWECYPAGFYGKRPQDKELSDDDCRKAYTDLLANRGEFEAALERVISEWKFSCEHYLTNESMNRIAWLGQSALCISRGVPAVFRGGFVDLSPEQQNQANLTALKYLNKWREKRGLEPLTLETSKSRTEANLY
jgi:hypothetical protein